MQQRLREAQLASLFRSVGRENGHRKQGRLSRLFGRHRLRRGHAGVELHDRGEDVWKAIRSI
jgi:hypothetical protein